jgi:hypothetical protein
MLLVKAALCTDGFLIATSFQCGMILSALTCLVMLLLTQASFYLFFRTWQFCANATYSDIWRITWGPTFSWVPTVFIVLAYLTVCETGVRELRAYSKGILAPLGVSGIWLNRWLWSYVGYLPCLIPCFLFPRLSSFAWISWLAFFVTAVALVALLVHLFRTRFVDGQYAFAADVPLVEVTFRNIIESMSGFNIAFFAYPFVFDIGLEMQRPTKNRILRLTWFANILTCLFVYGVPAVGYLLFSSVEPEDNIFLYLDAAAPEVLVGKIAVMIQSMTSTAFFTYYIARVVVLELCGTYKHSAVTYGCVGIVAVAVSVMINCAGAAASTSFYAIGGVCFSLLAFVLPPLFYLSQHKFRNVEWGIIAVVVCLIGGGLMMISLVLTIRDMMGLE